jgi:hypothetical protein
MVRPFLERIGRLTARTQRVTGPPTSSNGASSFHLFWEVPPRPLVEVAVTIEVIEPPTAPKLYFWALQASFEGDGVRYGGAHFGLQHHPDYPAAGAVNWGGYHHGGGELDGSGSTLPSALDNPNTRTFRWLPHRPYRYRIFPGPERGRSAGDRAPGAVSRRDWRGSITDLVSGAETVVRDLWVEGDALVSPMVWTEAFANCDDPSCAVRWTDLEAVTAEGERFAIDTVRLNYQTHADGGCANTDSSVADGGFVQRTSTERLTSTGARLGLGPPT